MHKFQLYRGQDDTALDIFNPHNYRKKYSKINQARKRFLKMPKLLEVSYKLLIGIELLRISYFLRAVKG